MYFLESLKSTDNIMLRTLSNNLSTDDISSLALLFNSSIVDITSNYRTIIRLNYERL